MSLYVNVQQWIAIQIYMALVYSYSALERNFIIFFFFIFSMLLLNSILYPATTTN